MQWSLSARRAWIEIHSHPQQCKNSSESLSARRAWIEIFCIGNLTSMQWSLSARRAWIEIWPFGAVLCLNSVALRKESVDRNKICIRATNDKSRVALRKESVDRNRVLLIIC